MKGVYAIGLVAVVLTVPAPLAAQTGAGSPPRPAAPRESEIEDTGSRGDRCARASTIVGRGVRPEPAAVWAFEAVTGCPDAGAALAAGLRAARRSSDLGALTPLVDHARMVRDGNIYQVAVELAGDRGASAAARASAFAVLADLKYPGRFPPYGALIRELELRQGAASDDDSTGAWVCRGLYHTSGPARTIGKSPPPDYQHRISVLAMEVAQDGGEPDAVRIIASCSL
jgi:hypothetical protein